MIFPFITSGLYLLVCYVLTLYQNNIKDVYLTNKQYKNFIKYFSIFHNIGLTLFSLYTFVSMYNVIKDDFDPLELKNWFINNTFNNTKMINLCELFLYSKVWEFFDTWLIMLKGQNTILLQKYHHFGAIWVWYIGFVYKQSPVMAMTFVNSFIHTIMYFYYLLHLFGIRLTYIKPFITLSQLIQLTFGEYFHIKYYILPRINIHQDAIISSIGSIYVIILIILFINFSIKTYLKKNSLNKIELKQNKSEICEDIKKSL